VVKFFLQVPEQMLSTPQTEWAVIFLHYFLSTNHVEMTKSLATKPMEQGGATAFRIVLPYAAAKLCR